MSTRVAALNSPTTFWNDYDVQAFERDFINIQGSGIRKVDRYIYGLQNQSYEYGIGSVTANGWIVAAKYGWYADLNGSTGSIGIANDKFSDGLQSLKIICTGNSGSQKPHARLTLNGSSYSGKDFTNLVKLKPNITYRVEVYIETSSVVAVSGGAVLRFRTIKKDGTYDQAEDKTSYVTGTSGMAKYTKEFTTGNETKYLELRAGIDNGTGTAWFDNLKIAEVGNEMKVEAQTVPTNSVKVAVGTSYIKINKNSADYVSRFEVTGSQNINIGANISGSTRYDLIVARVDTVTDPDINSSNIGILEAVQGVPGGSVPALPANSIPLAVVTVLNGQTVFQNSDIEDRRQPVKINLIDAFEGFGPGDLASNKDAKSPATAQKRGTVQLSEEPVNDESPVAVGDNDARMLTLQEKNNLISSLASNNIKIHPAGESITISGEPKLGYIDPTTGKVKVLDGSNLNNCFTKEGFILESGNGNITLSGFGAGSQHKFYKATSSTNHPTANTPPATLVSTFTNANSTALGTSDNTYETNSSGVNGEFAYQLLEYNIASAGFSLSTIDWIEILVEAMGGGGVLAAGFQVYIWNNTTLQWESIGSSNSAYGTDVEIKNNTKLKVAATVAKYVNGNNKLYLLLKTIGTSNGSIAINLSSDYSKLVVSQGVQVQVAGVIENLTGIVPGKYHFPAVPGTYSTKQIGNMVESGTVTLGNNGTDLAKAMAISDSDFSGFLKSLSVKVRKVNSGQDLYVYLIRSNSGPNAPAQGWPGAEVVMRTNLLKANINSSLTLFTFAVNKYLPKGRYYILVTTETQAIDVSNYLELASVSSGTGYAYKDAGSLQWTSTNSGRIFVTATVNVDYTTDPDRIAGQVARTQYSNGAPVAILGITETSGKIVDTIPKQYYQTTLSSIGNNANNSINANHVKITCGFRPRKIRISGGLAYAGTDDKVFILDFSEYSSVINTAYMDNAVAGTLNPAQQSENYFALSTGSNGASLTVGFIEDDGFTITPGNTNAANIQNPIQVECWSEI